MPKYSVSGTVVGGKYLGVVTADNVEQAEELGWNHLECYVSLCHQCVDECENAEISELHVELIEDSVE